MKWRGGRRSGNIEDRRGQSMGRKPGMRIGGIGVVVVFVVALVAGVDPVQLLQMLGGGQSTSYVEAPNRPAAPTEQADEQSDFVSVILADTEDTWTQIFADSGYRYEPPRLVIYSNMTRSACGLGQAAMGPFYCPPDRQVYLDLEFFQELTQRFGAPGDFAQAYVVAHEIGHHVQNLLGIGPEVHRRQQELGKREANALSVRLELQADCLAGVWAHHAHTDRNLLEPGDVEEGLQAATVIGDDMIQRKAQGRVVPESFTHGSSEQRVRWLRKGMETGRVDACDTFKPSKV